MELKNQLDHTVVLDENETDFFFHRPAIIVRIKSMVIDAVVLFTVMYFASILLNSFEVESGKLRGVVFITLLFYEPILIVFGGTIRQRVMGIKVVQAEEYVNKGLRSSIDLLSSLVRYFTKLVLGVISLFIIHIDKYGKAIHDNVSGSMVVFR